MESWQNSRQEFVDEMLRVYDKIGASAATGLDSEKSILIDREKLRALREKANRVDELEYEVSNLALQKRAQDFRANDARLLQKKTIENESLVEENARLTEDIGKISGVTLRVENLAQENQRLNAELQQSLRRLQEVEADEVTESRATPVVNDISSSSVRKIEHEGAEPVALEVYLSLIAKYNILAKNWSEMKVARKKLEEAVRKLKENAKKWANHADAKDKVLAKREDKIRRLEEEILALKDRLGTDKILTAPWSSGTISGHSTLNDVTKISRTENLGHVQIDEQVGGSENTSKALNSSAFKDIVTAPQPVEVAMSSPVRERPTQSGDRMPESTGSPSMLRTTEAETDLYAPELPMLFGAEGENSVDDTQFEIFGPHHSGSTEGEVEPNSPEVADEQNAANSELPNNPTSSPAPVVISTRSVRKRKGPKGSAQSPVTRIKVETISSSPIGLATFGLDESIDLDEIGDKQATPKKKRPKQSHVAPGLSLLLLNTGRRYRSEGLDQCHPSFEQEFGKRSQSVPFGELGPGQKGTPLRPLSTNGQILPRTSDARAQKRRRIVSDQVVEELLEDGATMGPMSSKPTKHNEPSFAQRLGDLLDKPSPCKNAITPVSRLDGLQISTTTRKNASGSRMYEPDPADDFHSQPYQGNAMSETPGRLSNQLSAATLHGAAVQLRWTSKGSERDFAEISRSSSEGVLKDPTYDLKSSPENLAEKPRPSSKRASEDPTYRSRPTSRDFPVIFDKDFVTSSQKIMDLPATRKMPWDENGKPLKAKEHNFITPTRPPLKAGTRAAATSGRMTVSKRLSRAAEEVFNAEVDHPQNEPLRSRPIHKLDPEDFKINPNYNQGYKHAFNEVVRNKDDRKCLQGCTKPDCCGAKWRALAKEELARHAQPPTLSQEENDVTILGEFMGDNAYKLFSMTEAERFEMLIQAKTRDLANKFGRHRHAYERRSSPPGFWRFEFPNTQEQKEDAKKADAQKKELVRTRYEEAMRPGGRFLFRDE